MWQVVEIKEWKTIYRLTVYELEMTLTEIVKESMGVRSKDEVKGSEEEGGSAEGKTALYMLEKADQEGLPTAWFSLSTFTPFPTLAPQTPKGPGPRH